MKKKYKYILVIFLIVFLLWTIFPFYWMFATSVKTNAELYNHESNPFLIKDFTWEHFDYLFKNTNFFIWYKNSFLIAISVTAITLIISFLAGYSLSRLRLRGSTYWGLLIFVAYLVPPTLLFIPLAKVVNTLNLTDSMFALIMTYPTFTVPFTTWMLMSYFSTIPFELEESALIDGANRGQILFRIILPVSLPSIVTVGIFTFTLSWGEMIYALIFISTTFKKTLPVGIIGELVRGDVFYWGSLMAAALLASVPLIIIYSFFTDLYISGLTKGSVKG